MVDALSLLEPTLTEEARAWLAEARASVPTDSANRLPVLFPQLVRRFGREPLSGGRRLNLGEGVVADLGAWRACDAAGLLLVSDAAPGDDALIDLYLHGDLEERTILLRCASARPVTRATLRLLGEVQRTNTVVHVEAGALDSNVAMRALEQDGPASGFTEEDFHRLVLKIAFLDLPIWRMTGALDQATPELSAMLIDYATEREAAGRSVWVDTYRFIGRAPAPGAAARLLGGIEHGDDAVRLAAAEGLRDLADPDLAPFAEARLAREPRETIRALLSPKDAPRGSPSRVKDSPRG